MTTTPVKPHIRWMIRGDMPAVTDIETLSHRNPWGEDGFLRALRTRNCIGMVAEIREQVVAYMLYELHKRKLHLLDFAVHPEKRLEGIGKHMLGKLLSKLSQERRTHITASVRETNLGAQIFFRSCGFRAEKVIRGLFQDTGEDAYHFVWRLPNTSTPDTDEQVTAWTDFGGEG